VTPIIVAVIVSLPPTAAVIISARKNAKKVEEIHLLVNSRLATALEELEEVRTALQKERS